jgi:putative transposon-encoded protein
MSKRVLSEEFEFTVQTCGNSAHIRLSNKWLGKRVRVKVEEIKE